MTRFTALRLSAFIAALSLSLGACAEDYPVVPQFQQPGSTITTGIISFQGDPAIVDILLSGCDETEIPASVMHLATWREEEGAYAVELSAGCYDIRVVRESYEGLVTQQQLGLFVAAGQAYAFAPDA